MRSPQERLPAQVPAGAFFCGRNGEVTRATSPMSRLASERSAMWNHKDARTGKVAFFE